MLIIGLTGGIGSGKTSVATFFTELRITVIDADMIARRVTEIGSEALKKMVDHFGENILHPDGRLNRSACRERVFANPEEREWLEQLLHPLIRKEMLRQAGEARSPYCILVIPLLIENHIDYVDRICVVDTAESLQIQRTQQRDQISEEEVQSIMASQCNRTERLNAADDVIHNDGSLESLKEQVQKLHQFYLKLA